MRFPTILSFIQWVEARDLFVRALNLMGAEQRSCKTMWGQFWSAHQRFFKYLCISAKVEHCVKVARDAIKSGKARTMFAKISLRHKYTCLTYVCVVLL